MKYINNLLFNLLIQQLLYSKIVNSYPKTSRKPQKIIQKHHNISYETIGPDCNYLNKWLKFQYKYTEYFWLLYNYIKFLTKFLKMIFWFQIWGTFLHNNFLGGDFSCKTFNLKKHQLFTTFINLVISFIKFWYKKL